jgi:hypothetical protein
MTWKVSNREKKNVTQVETWTRGELTATREVGWRWGKWKYDTKPDLSIYKEDDQHDVYDFGDVTDSDLDDGCWAEWTWPDSMDPDEIQLLEGYYDEEGDEGLENEGWTLDDTETFVTGPLDVEFVPENYQKKPVVIQAVKFTGENEEELRLFCGDTLGVITETEAHIRTLEDGAAHQVEHIATIGDYIIKGIKGEFYACKPDIFEASYESTWREYSPVTGND